MSSFSYDFQWENLFDIHTDLIVVPFSTIGSMTRSFRQSLDDYAVDTIIEGENYKLGSTIKVDIKQSVPSKLKKSVKHIVFACTVHDYSSAYYAIRAIGLSVGRIANEHTDIKSIALPLLGAGAGGLDPIKVVDIFINAFNQACSLLVKLTICVPDKEIFRALKNSPGLLQVSSAKLVIIAEKSRILENFVIQKIQYEEGFFYELAAQKFDEYLNYEVSDENIYEELEEGLKSRGVTYSNYLNAMEVSSEKHQFLTLCGELVAYIDYHAYRKNTWNLNPDKRVIARSAVRQTDWIINLTRFKRTYSFESLSPSIKNVFDYFDNPANNLTMLSVKHREMVVEALSLNTGTSAKELNKLVQVFRELGYNTRNPGNFGALCSRILYLPYIRQLWDENANENYFDTILIEETESNELSVAVRLIEFCQENQSISLDLGNCGLTDLTQIPELFECDHLEELILSNEWPVFENGMWNKMRSQNRGRQNFISLIPEEIKQLTKLKVFFCGGDWATPDKKSPLWGIDSLKNIIDLPDLEYLNLSNNSIVDTTGLGKHKKLKVVHLNNNRIASVEHLEAMGELLELNLSNNLITEVDFLRRLNKTTTLDLHNNSIRDISPLEELIVRIGIVNDKWKKGTINIAKNPLGYPPMEIIVQGKDAVIRTLKDIAKSGQYINRDIKVVLVGNSEAGKSTLVKYLDNQQGLELSHSATLWMDEKIIICPYIVGKIEEKCLLHVFDFGGHDYYHDTHHLFYSTNTIYVLLWEDRTNNLQLRQALQENKGGFEVLIETQDYPIKYWLDSIEFHTRDIIADNINSTTKKIHTYSSKLLLVQNKVPNSELISHLNNKQLCENYSFIYDIINVSIKKPERNMNLFGSIFQEMLDKMDIVGEVLPKFYEAIKGNLINYRGKPVLTRDEFRVYCNTLINLPIDAEQNDILIEYLHQIGFILYSDKVKKGKVYVDKKWIIGNIHKILLNLSTQKGEFDRKYIIDIIGNETQNLVDDLLAMMLEFKMIFKHPNKDIYIAPLYLPRKPDGFVQLFLSDKMIPYRRFEYAGFIHKNVVLSIFQKYSSLIPAEKIAVSDTFYYWKDGLIIKDPSSLDIVMIVFNLGTNEGNAFIDVFNVHKNLSNNHFINSILNYISEVNKGYEVDEIVSLDGVDFISLKVLEKNAHAGRVIFSEKKLTASVSVTTEERYFKLKDYQHFIPSNIIRKKKVVISYSKADIHYVHDLVRYLKPLIANELIEDPWYCEEAKVGIEWDEEIKGRFQTADIVFFMVSDNLYNVPYVIENEIERTILRYDKDNSSVKIIPIILEYYDWERPDHINLKRFSALPFKGKPISDYDKPKVAWHMVSAQVKQMIERDIDPSKKELVNRELQALHERQMQGRLDRNTP